jgi:hypothetical protein
MNFFQFLSKNLFIPINIIFYGFFKLNKILNIKDSKLIYLNQLKIVI